MVDFIFFPFFLLSGFIGLLGTLFWLWMLIECALYEPNTGNTKIVWILIIIFLPFIGSLFYLLLRRPQRIREVGV